MFVKCNAGIATGKKTSITESQEIVSELWQCCATTTCGGWVSPGEGARACRSNLGHTPYLMRPTPLLITRIEPESAMLQFNPRSVRLQITVPQLLLAIATLDDGQCTATVSLQLAPLVCKT